MDEYFETKKKIDINRIALTLEDKIARDKIIKWMKRLFI